MTRKPLSRRLDTLPHMLARPLLLNAFRCDFDWLLRRKSHPTGPASQEREARQ